MTRHHQGGIEMAAYAVRHTSTAAVRQTAVGMVDEQNQEVEFRELMTNSVWYVLLNRCGLDAQEYLDAEDFRHQERSSKVQFQR